MTKIKLCGLSRPQDIALANALRPDFIGLVFAPGSRRRVTAGQARALRNLLAPGISAVGVFTDAPTSEVAGLLEEGVIDIAQLHGSEDEAYIGALRELTDRPIWKAFRLGAAHVPSIDSSGAGTGSRTAERERVQRLLAEAERSTADMVLLDSGAGTGMVLNWELLRDMRRPFILAGGLNPDNVGAAVRMLRPEAVDVSSGIEIEGYKNAARAEAFTAAVRKEEEYE